MPPLPVTWYLKPALPAAGICVLIGAALILLVPQPLWSLSLSTQRPSGYNTNPVFYALLFYFFWTASSASCMLLLMRAWRYHATLGISTALHSLSFAAAAASLIFGVWLILSCIVWAGVRTAFQDYYGNPWFPFFSLTENAVPIDWLLANLFFFTAWIAIWTRWHTAYHQVLPTITIAVLGHLLAIPCFMLQEPDSRLPILLFLAFYASFVLIPAARQLRDTEAL